MLIPRTCLLFYGEILLSSNGQYLEIFDVKTSQRTSREKVFPSQIIHGISILEEHDSSQVHVLIWGGRLLRLLQFRYSYTEASAYNHLHLEKASSVATSVDWILDGSFKPLTEAKIGYEFVAFLITAHNALTKVDITTSAHIDVALTENVHNEGGFLYTAHLSWLKGETLLVAAGTAFGEISLWSYSAQDPQLSNSCRHQSHFFFPAHDGSVFGIATHFLQDAADPTLPRAVVGSCSDDRNIQLWDASAVVTCLLEGKDEKPHLDVTKPHRRPLPCLGQTWAHLSRIWGIRFIPPPEEELAYSFQLLSYGEDATSQRWLVNLMHGTEMKTTWKNLGVIHTHSGKNIWALATSRPHEAVFNIATSGADCGLQISRLALREKTPSVFHSDGKGFDFSHLKILHESEAWTSTSNSDGFKAYCFVGPSMILLTTNFGSVLEAGWDTTILQPHLHWRYLTTYPGLRSYSIVSGLTQSRLGFVAGSDGKVYCYRSGVMVSEPVLDIEAKVSGIFCQRLPQQNVLFPKPAGETVIVLATALGLSTAVVKLMEDSVSNLAHQQINSATTLNLPNSFIVTSMNACRGSDAGYLLSLGSRDGQVLMYYIRPSKEQYLVQQVGPELQLHKDAITAILWAKANDRFENDATDFHLLTVGRDSTYGIHRCFEKGSHMSVSTKHRISLPFGPNIEGVHIDDKSQLIFHGFHGKDFVVYNETAKRQVMAVPCGGAHRVWAYSQHLNSFIWTKASKLHAESSDESSSKQQYEAGAHGREIKACAIVEKVITSSQDRIVLVATGAEDTDIRLFQYTSSTRGMEELVCTTILRRHNTGVQQLRWSSRGGYLFSCGGSMEFFVWKVCAVPFVKIGVLCESHLPIMPDSTDVRIMDFAVTGFRSTAISNSVPEKLDEDIFVITMIFSDSTIKRYRYESTSLGSQWQLLHQTSFTTCCLTQVADIFWPCGTVSTVSANSIKEDYTVLTLATATDGHLISWQDRVTDSSTARNVESELGVIKKVHQNTIKSMQVTQLLWREFRQKFLLVITTGDDNALGLTLLKVNIGNLAILEYCSTVVVPRAHAASITASLLFERSRLGVMSRDPNRSIYESATATSKMALTLITSGNDQRVRSWSIGIIFDEHRHYMIHVSRVGNRFTAVADVASLALLSHSKFEGLTNSGFRTSVMVCGVGVEVMQFD